MSYDFKNTQLYKDKWYVFKDAVLSDIEVDDCLSTVEGNCLEVKNIDECLDSCETSPKCEMGYYIESPKRNLCGHLTYYTIPYYRLSPSSIYPKLKNSMPYFFTSKEVLPFPPKLPNAIFYKDLFALKISSEELYIYEGENEQVDVSNNYYAEVRFIPSRTTKPRIQQYIPVRHGDEVAINIPNTGLLLARNDVEIGFTWQLKASDINVPSATFRIFSTDKERKIGDILSFSEKFYFIDNDKPIVYSKEKGTLVIHDESIENAKEDKVPFEFELVPKIDVFYCQNGQCKKTGLESCKTIGYNAFFDEEEVHRDPNCWGFCSPLSTIRRGSRGSSFPRTTALVVLLIIGIILSLIL